MSTADQAEFDRQYLRFEHLPASERREVIRTLFLAALHRDRVGWFTRLIDSVTQVANAGAVVLCSRPAPKDDVRAFRPLRRAPKGRAA